MKITCLKLLPLCAACLALSFAPSARADAVYQYVGNGFTTGTETLPCSPSCQISGTVDEALPLAPDSSTTTWTNYSFTDGVDIFTPSNSSVLAFDLETDGTGAIDGWAITVETDDLELETCYYEPATCVYPAGLAFAPAEDSVYDSANGGFGFDLYDPGTFSQIPEPGSAGLMVIALLGIAAVPTFHKIGKWFTPTVPAQSD